MVELLFSLSAVLSIGMFSCFGAVSKFGIPLFQTCDFEASLYGNWLVWGFG